MNELLVGYARVSTEQQDLTAQRNGLQALGVGDDRIYVDNGLTGTNRDRPGLALALAAGRSGDTLVVTKVDRLARSLPDARDILDELTKRNVKVSLGGSIHDPTDPVGRLLFNVLAMVAEFESDLIKLRTREGMKVAKAKGRLCGKQPKLKLNQAKHLLELHGSGNYTQAELAELFGVGRSTIYRTIERLRPKPAEPERPFTMRPLGVSAPFWPDLQDLTASRHWLPLDPNPPGARSRDHAVSGECHSRVGSRRALTEMATDRLDPRWRAVADDGQLIGYG